MAETPLDPVSDSVDPILRTAIPVATPVRPESKEKDDQDLEDLLRATRPNNASTTAENRPVLPPDEYYVPRTYTPDWESQRVSESQSPPAASHSQPTESILVPRPKEEYYIPRDSTAKWNGATTFQSQLEEMARRMKAAESERDEMSETMTRQYKEWNRRRESMETALNAFEEMQEEMANLKAENEQLSLQMKRNDDSKSFFAQIEGELADLEKSYKLKLRDSEQTVGELRGECDRLRHLETTLEDRAARAEANREAADKGNEESLRDARISAEEDREALRQAKLDVTRLQTELAKHKASTTQARAAAQRSENSALQARKEREKLDRTHEEDMSKIRDLERQAHDRDGKHTRVVRDWRKRVDQLREEQASLRSEIEKLSDELQRQKERVKRYKKGEAEANTIVAAQTEKVTSLTRQLDTDVTSLRRELAEKERLLSDANRANIEHESDMSLLRGKNGELSAALFEAVSERERLQQSVDDVMRQVDELKTLNSSLTDDLSAERETQESLRMHVSELRATIEDMRREGEMEMESMRTAHADELEDVEGSNAEMRARLSDMESACWQKDGALREAGERCSELASACELLRNELSNLRKALAHAESRCFEAESKYGKIEEKFTKMEDRARQADAFEESLRQESDKHGKSVEEWRLFVDRLKADGEREMDAQQRLNDQHVASLQKRIEKIESEKLQLQDAVSSLRDEINQMTVSRVDLDKQFSAAMAQISDLESKRVDQERVEKLLMEQRQKFNDGIAVAQTEADDVMRHNEKLEQENSRLAQRVKDLSADRDLQIKHAAELQRRLQSLEKRHRAEAEKEVEEARILRQKCDREAAAVETRLKEHAVRFRALESELEMQMQACNEANERARKAEELLSARSDEGNIRDRVRQAQEQVAKLQQQASIYEEK